tara:strand:+ start:878 stop:1174 length:297 start_codon:yes stop_codon:yes gene_type:complete
MRYSNTKILKREGKRVYSTTFYPKIRIQDSDVYVNVPRGTRLDQLANKYYGDVSLWWIISKANDLSGAEIQLDPSKTYRIPTQVTGIVSEFNDLNRKK